MIVLVGPYPPPYGGISIHVKRLAEYLQNKHINFILINEFALKVRQRTVLNKLRKLGSFTQLLKTQRNDIVHLNTSTGGGRLEKFALALLFRKKGQKLIFSVHGNNGVWSIEDIHTRSIKKKMYFFLLSKFDHIILDNTSQLSILQNNKINIEYSFISEFIPPIVKEEDYERIPKTIWNFYKSHETVMYAMASVSFINAVDLYGLDMLIGLMKRLYENENANVGLIINIVDCRKGNREYYQNIKTQVKQNGLENNIMFVEESYEEIYPLEREADLMIRPSCTDGDSVSVRESLFFGVPVVTSDAVPRPDGCVIFKNRDMDDFEQKVRYALDNLPDLKKNIKKWNMPDNAQEIINLYKRLEEKE